jgi:putative NIF3 family GTP cyclohydrolase 1 type 2
LANCLGLKKIKPFLKTSSELSAFGQEKQNYLGRIGICEKTSVKEFALFVKERLNCNGVRFSECGRPVEKVAVIGGSGGSFYIDALKAGADTLVTGDCKYSSFLPAKELGLNIIDAGHFATENAVLLPLKDMLSKNFNEIHFEIAKTNIDCVEYLQ